MSARTPDDGAFNGSVGRPAPERSLGDVAAVLESIVEASPLAMATTEGVGHLVRYANPAFCRLTGRPVEAVMGRPLAEVLPELQEQGAGALLDRVYEMGATGQAVDLRPAHVGSGWTHATYTAWPILGDHHQSTGVLMEVTDTTGEVIARARAADDADQVRDVNQRLLVAGLAAQEHADTQTALNVALRELLEARARLADERETQLARERAARDQAEAAVRVRDEFLAIASHELRTPLTAIKATAQMALRVLERGVLENIRAAQHFDIIRISADRLELLLGDLMDVSRMRREGPIVRPEPMDLTALVRSLAQRYADGSGDHHRLVTHLPAGPVLVAGDSGRLEQVLDNMLSNALKYTPDGGEIAVRLDVLVHGSSSNAVGMDTPWARDERAGAVLTVTDTGIGLPAGERKRIFEPFGRATNATRQGLPGMGLGLYICRQIVDAHGGRMWAESAGEGQGTTLGVWLPLGQASTASEQTPAERDDE